MNGGRASAAFENGADRAWLEVAWIISRMMRQGATDVGIVDALRGLTE